MTLTIVMQKIDGESRSVDTLCCNCNQHCTVPPFADRRFVLCGLCFVKFNKLRVLLVDLRQVLVKLGCDTTIPSIPSKSRRDTH
jgi:hypothetical protein